MSQPEKIYVPRSSAKEITFQASGKTIIKLGFCSKDLVEFIRSHTNPNGYINFGISRRREVSEKGSTHCVWLDTWQPEQRKQQPQPQPEQPSLAKIDPADVPENDDVPFN